MLNLKNKYLIVIAGPTAVGKTLTGISIAKHFRAPILSADSRQIFRELKTGTAVPTDRQLKEVPHYFIRNKSIHDSYNASKYETEANQLLNELFPSHPVILLVGGSGLYIDAVCRGIDDIPETEPEVRQKIREQYEKEGVESLRKDLKILDPDSYEKIDLKNHKRIQKALEVSITAGRPYSSFLTHNKKPREYRIIKIALDLDRDELYERINSRIRHMVDDGLEQEARSVYRWRDNNALNTVGYKEFFMYFDGRARYEEAILSIQANTRRYARKQLTWFRKDKDYRWFNPPDTKEIIEYIGERLGEYER